MKKEEEKNMTGTIKCQDKKTRSLTISFDRQDIFQVHSLEREREKSVNKNKNKKQKSKKVSTIIQGDTFCFFVFVFVVGLVWFGLVWFGESRLLRTSVL